MADITSHQQKDMPSANVLPSHPTFLTLRNDRIVSAMLFLCVSSLYFATTSGITSSNDGSHYALTRAIVEKRTFEIWGFDQYAEGNDIARVGDHLYSDRPPGTALVASLFYTAGDLLPTPSSSLPSRHDAENPRLLYVMLLPVGAGAATVMLLYLVLRELDVSALGALTASSTLALGTTHWKYSSVLFSHAPSALTVMLATYGAVRLTRAAVTSRRSLVGLGFVLGWAVLFEYSNAILVMVIVLYLLANARPFDSRQLAFRAGFLGIGGAIPAGFLAFYNTVNFGGPFTTSYAYAVNYPWAARFSTTFSFPLLKGLRAMLIWGEGDGWCNPTCYNQGLFLLSPVLLLSFLGLATFWRRARREFFLVVGLFGMYLGLFSKHHTFHGFTADGRYLVPFVGLWCIPLGFCLDWLLGQSQKPARQAAANLLFYGLLFLSARNIFLHVGFSYNYHLDLSRLDSMIAKPENWSYLSDQVWPNTKNLPILWFLGLVGLAGYLVGRWGAGKRANSLDEIPEAT